MSNLYDFRSGRPMPEPSAPRPFTIAGPFTAHPDQVTVTHRGETRTFETYGDLRACVLVDCREGLDAERDAAIARAIAADRRQRDRAQLQVIGRLVVLAALIGSAAAVVTAVSA